MTSALYLAFYQLLTAPAGQWNIPSLSSCHVQTIPTAHWKGVLVKAQLLLKQKRAPQFSWNDPRQKSWTAIELSRDT